MLPYYFGEVVGGSLNRQGFFCQLEGSEKEPKRGLTGSRIEVMHWPDRAARPTAGMRWKDSLRRNCDIAPVVPPLIFTVE